MRHSNSNSYGYSCRRYKCIQRIAVPQQQQFQHLCLVSPRLALFAACLLSLLIANAFCVNFRQILKAQQQQQQAQACLCMSLLVLLRGSSSSDFILFFFLFLVIFFSFFFLFCLFCLHFMPLFFHCFVTLPHQQHLFLSLPLFFLSFSLPKYLLKSCIYLLYANLLLYRSKCCLRRLCNSILSDFVKCLS